MLQYEEGLVAVSKSPQQLSSSKCCWHLLWLCVKNLRIIVIHLPTAQPFVAELQHCRYLQLLSRLLHALLERRCYARQIPQ